MVESTSIHWQPAGSNARLCPFRGVFLCMTWVYQDASWIHQDDMGPISHPPKPWFVTVGCRVDVSHQEWESKGPSPKASTKGSMVVKSSLKAVYFLCLGGPGGIWWKVGWYFPRRWVPQTGQIAPQSIAVIIHTTGACWGLLCCDAGLTWKKSRWVSI